MTAKSTAEETVTLASRIVVAIPTLNEEAAIRDCLVSLMTGDPELDQVEFVVADGGSRDATCQIVQDLMVQHPNLRLINNPDRLQSAAVNQVALIADELNRDILVRCDAHSVYPDKFVLRVARTLAERDSASVVVPMDAVGQNCFANGAAWVVDTPIGSGGSAHRGGRRSAYVDHGHHAGFALPWFKQVGGYDPSFSHNEDAELDKRITDAGGKIWLDSDIRIVYFMRNSWSKLAKQYFNYGKGRARTVLKHRLKPRLRQLIPVLNLLFLVACAVLALLLHPVFWSGLVLYLAALALVGLWITYQRRSSCGLAAGPALVAIHLAWAYGFVLQMTKARRQ